MVQLQVYHCLKDQIRLVNSHVVDDSIKNINIVAIAGSVFMANHTTKRTAGPACITQDPKGQRKFSIITVCLGSENCGIIEFI